nr:glycosyltransferase family 4 protein [uncultured Shinella sp.]
MRVLHLSNSLLWRGGENQFALLLENMDPAVEHHVAVPAGSPLMARLGHRFESTACGNRGFLDVSSLRAVRRLLRSGNFDLIHAHTSPAHKLALLARVGLDIPLVVSRRNAYRISGGLTYKLVDRFAAVSNAAREQLVAGGVNAAKITVIHDAVDAKSHETAFRERAGLEEDRIVILCVAALSQEKDHDTLLTAWERAARRIPQATLVLAGDGPLAGAVAARAASLPNVVSLGWRDDVINLIHGSDILTLSSREEGLGSSLCEGQWAGKPVVATRAGGIPEVVADGETGLLADVGDASGLAERLVALVEDPERRAAMGVRARERSRLMFAPGRIADRHVALYRDAIAARR